MRPHRSLLLLLASCAFAAPEGSGESPLAAFLPDPTIVARLQPTIDRLESESFAEREAATRELASLPSLPAFIRELAVSEKRPETRHRLRKISGDFSIRVENDRLNAILRKITDNGTKGEYDRLTQVIARNVWSPAQTTVENAARATVTEADLPELKLHLASESPAIRRVAAAALGGLPGGETTDMLVALLQDRDPNVALRAATELGNRKDNRSLAALVRLLDSPAFHIRHFANLALRGLSGRDFGFDPGADSSVRAVAVAQWKEWAASKEAGIAGKPLGEMPIILFSGGDLGGWAPHLGNEPMETCKAWEVSDGELICRGRRFIDPGDLWSTGRYEHYVLTLDYKADAKDGDSGIGLLLTEKGERAERGPQYLEVQLLPENGGDIYQIGGVTIKAGGKPVDFQCPRIADPKDIAGNWNRIKLIVRNGTVTVEINGVTVNRTSEGPRGPGRIVLRNEGSPFAFRNLMLQPLPDPPAE